MSYIPDATPALSAYCPKLAQRTEPYHFGSLPIRNTEAIQIRTKASPNPFEIVYGQGQTFHYNNKNNHHREQCHTKNISVVLFYRPTSKKGYWFTFVVPLFMNESAYRESEWKKSATAGSVKGFSDVRCIAYVMWCVVACGPFVTFRPSQLALLSAGQTLLMGNTISKEGLEVRIVIHMHNKGGISEHHWLSIYNVWRIRVYVRCRLKTKITQTGNV